MITLKELLSGNDFEKLPEEHKPNLNILLQKINIIRSNYGKPLIVSSGYRSLEHHKEIYKNKGIPEDKIPMKSKHLSGEAVDIYDPRQELQKWVLNNLTILEHAGLYCEDFAYTKNWIHFQIIPPASNKRFFIP